MRRNLTLSCHTYLGAHRREPSTTCAENLSNRVEINSTPRILGILIMNSKDNLPSVFFEYLQKLELPSAQ